METKQIVIGTRTLSVVEQSMRVMLPLLEGDQRRVTVELAKVCVFEDGELLGDAVLDLGMRDFNRIMAAIKDVHGFGEEDDSGNVS